MPTTILSFGASGSRNFLTAEHEVHKVWTREWDRIERGLRGGVHVRSALRRFDWELATGESYKMRQDQANYVNFPRLYLDALVGQIERQYPLPQQGLSF